MPCNMSCFVALTKCHLKADTQTSRCQNGLFKWVTERWQTDRPMKFLSQWCFKENCKKMNNMGMIIYKCIKEHQEVNLLVEFSTAPRKWYKHWSLRMAKSAYTVFPTIQEALFLKWRFRKSACVLYPEG